MSIVPSVSDNEQEISNSITRFICDFKVGSLLKQCGCKKEKGIAFMKLFTYILCNVFRDRSMYMQKKTGSFKEDFSKNAYYRFFRNAHANWLRFTTLLSEKIINGHLRDLTSEDRVDCFVVDDSLYERIGYKKRMAALLSRSTFLSWLLPRRKISLERQRNTTGALLQESDGSWLKVKGRMS